MSEMLSGASCQKEVLCIHAGGSGDKWGCGLDVPIWRKTLNGVTFVFTMIAHAPPLVAYEVVLLEVCQSDGSPYRGPAGSLIEMLYAQRMQLEVEGCSYTSFVAERLIESFKPDYECVFASAYLLCKKLGLSQEDQATSDLGGLIATTYLNQCKGFALGNGAECPQLQIVDSDKKSRDFLGNLKTLAARLEGEKGKLAVSLAESDHVFRVLNEPWPNVVTLHLTKLSSHMGCIEQTQGIRLLGSVEGSFSDVDALVASYAMGDLLLQALCNAEKAPTKKTLLRIALESVGRSLARRFRKAERSGRSAAKSS